MVVLVGIPKDQRTASPPVPLREQANKQANEQFHIVHRKQKQFQVAEYRYRHPVPHYLLVGVKNRGQNTHQQNLVLIVILNKSGSLLMTPHNYCHRQLNRGQQRLLGHQNNLIGRPVNNLIHHFRPVHQIGQQPSVKDHRHLRSR